MRPSIPLTLHLGRVLRTINKKKDKYVHASMEYLSFFLFALLIAGASISFAAERIAAFLEEEVVVGGGQIAFVIITGLFGSFLGVC